MHVAHQYFCKDCHLLHPVHCYLCMEKSHETSSSAAQPVKALRSITDVQRWLKNNEVVLSSSAEVMRIREVVDELSRKPKPRQEAIQRFFKP